MILLVFLETALMMVGFNRHLAKMFCGDWAWTWVIMGAFFEKVPEKNCIAEIGCLFIELQHVKTHANCAKYANCILYTI